ncbi:hypothetical protein K4F52_003338 [Lecanicillium sp. MT-2017a]|nr:hypothetical protein K4F52_003338 [Lecanicillium sp. MT-2017a]
MAAIWRRREWQAKTMTSSPSNLAFGFNVDEVLWLTQQTAEMLEEIAENLSETHLRDAAAHGVTEPARDGSSQNQALRSPFNQQGFARPGEFARTQQVENELFDLTANADLNNIVGLLEFGFDDVFLDQLLDNDPSTWPSTL